MIQTLNAHLPWLLLMITITIQSSLSNIRLPDLGFDFIDKAVHFLVFGMLGWLLARGMSKSNRPILKNHSMIFILVAGGLFGLIDEWHQSMVPGRMADIRDWLADMAGIYLFALYYNWKFKHTAVS